MKLRNFDNFLIKEASQSNGHREAMKLGLNYKGGGYWEDPKTGNVSHQTVDGELVPYQGAGGPLEGDSGGPMNPATMADKNMDQQGVGPTNAPGTGILKAPEPGTEQHPRGANWNPGPNGDNCVQDQPPPDDLSFDMFVGKTNYYKWVAGKDGSNYKNLDYKDFTNEEEEPPAAKAEKIEHSFDTFLAEDDPTGEMQKKAEIIAKARMDRVDQERQNVQGIQQPQDPVVDGGNPTPAALGGKSPGQKAQEQGLRSNGHGSYIDPQTGEVVARTVQGELVWYDGGAGGGVVSDGAGGDKLATSQPSHQNSTTGQIVVPPANPESPEEKAAIPDSIPATPPSGYDKEVDKKARRKYADAAAQDQIDVVNAEAEEKYNNVEGGRIFSLSTKRIIDAMTQSDDEEERAIGNHMMDVMVDSADMISNALKDIPVDQLPDATASLRRMAEREARERYLLGLQDDEDTTGDDNENEVEDSEELQALRDEKQKEAEEFEDKFGVKPTGFDGVDVSNKPDYAKQKGFTDTLPRSNEEYVETMDVKFKNGVEFVDLKGVIGEELQYVGIPEKYLDFLSRSLITKKNETTKKISHFVEGAGAGQINSQAGELVHLMLGPLSPEGREKLTSALYKSIDQAKKNGTSTDQMILTKEWVDAAVKNTEALDFYMYNEHGGAKITGGAWDNESELAAIGIGDEEGTEKGYSTDVAFIDENGNTHQISLKKDKNANFLNSGAGSYNMMLLDGALQDPEHPQHEAAKTYYDNIDKIQQIREKYGLDKYDSDSVDPPEIKPKYFKEQGFSQKEANELAKEHEKLRQDVKKQRNDMSHVPESHNLNAYNEKENERLKTNFKSHKTQIKDLSVEDLNTKTEDILNDSFDAAGISDKTRAKFFDKNGKAKNVTKPGAKDDPEEFEQAKALYAEAKKTAKEGAVSGKIEKAMKKTGLSFPQLVDKIASGNVKPSELGLKPRELNKLMMNAIYLTKSEESEQMRKEIKDSEQEFANSALTAIKEDPAMKAGTLASLRKNFPIKEIAEGTESMIVGDVTFSKKILSEVFGTNDFEKIKDDLTLDTDEEGNPFLGYVAKVDKGKKTETIPIANVVVRADGLGYGNTMKHEMTMRPDFYDRLRAVNKKYGMRYTTEEILQMMSEHLSFDLFMRKLNS